jgi:hypothetical protein
VPSASIQQGQKAASSPSKAGGAAPDTELTPEALANMSDERLAEILELQARGDTIRARFPSLGIGEDGR